VALVALPALVRADGGVVRAREVSGPFVLTVFTTPTPLRTGPADVSVMVQDRDTLEPVLDARVVVTLTATEGGGAPTTASATRARAANKLLYAASVVLPRVGEWRLRAAVERRGQHAEIECAAPVEAGPLQVLVFWPWLVFPFVAVALAVLNRHLARGRRPRAVSGRA